MLQETPDIVLRLGIALAIGLLIGLERGWHERERAEGQRIAGFRTFGLIGLLGGITSLFEGTFGGLVVAAGLIAVAGAFGVAQWYDLRNSADISITTNVAALAAFGLGALAGYGAIKSAAASGVVVALLLGIKPELHQLLQRIERTELLATLRLLLISVVILPVLPDRAMGPWDSLNPYRLWWMVVLVAGISYIGYFSIKLIGRRRGVLLTGLLGGLISSTATTVSLSRLARQQPAQRDVMVAGILVSTATMFPRTLLIAGVIAPALTWHLAGPLLAAAAAAYAAGFFFARLAERRITPDDEPRPEPENPLDLKTALQFAAFLALVMVLARGTKSWLGDPGLYALAALSGSADIDAVTLSFGTMINTGEAPLRLVLGAIVLAAAVNTLVKPALVFYLGGRQAGFRVLLAVVPALLVAGGCVYLFGWDGISPS